MTPLAHGRIVLWQGASLWTFDVPPFAIAPKRTDFHAHHAIQVTLALEGRFELHVADRSVPGPVAVVGADVRHAFEPQGLISLLFVEPESPAGRVVSSTLLADEPVAAVPLDLLGTLPVQISAAFRAPGGDGGPLRDIGRSMIERLAGDAEPPAPDPRVQTTIAWAAGNLERRLGASEAARNVGLSVDRMSHLFVEQTGLPFRTYLLWLRMTKAVEVYAAGASLTEAAHEAGFADSAHFSRTFRRMFGVAAAALRLA
ncbi:MAG TPA: AraC family transcriptional regulator [Caulobacteraceae bacterium]|jgi:AraC-like DNA-binding protein|nr:AraC family transcriptional regulator [Caulobacteraceae bacterium]